LIRRLYRRWCVFQRLVSSSSVCAYKLHRWSIRVTFFG